MRKSLTITCSLIISAVIILTGGLAVAWDTIHPKEIMSKSIEKACHRAVKKAAPLGYRDIENIAYVRQKPSVGVAEGRFSAKYGPDEWVGVVWTCNIHPKNKRVISLQVEKDQTRRNFF